jgi:hypothetical protein
VAGINGGKLKYIAKKSPVSFCILGIHNDMRSIDQWMNSGFPSGHGIFSLHGHVRNPILRWQVHAILKNSFFAPSVVRARDIISVGVHNWTDFCREKLHPAGMHHDRIQKITTEMCDLLNEQTEWLKSSTGRLTAQSGEAVDEYVHRNDRLRQLGAELSELD